MWQLTSEIPPAAKRFASCGFRTTDNPKGFVSANCQNGVFKVLGHSTDKDVGWAGSVSPETPAISGFHGIAETRRFKIG